MGERITAASRPSTESSTASRIPERSGAFDLDSVSGAVAFEDVSFGYPGSDEPVVEDISFSVERGAFIGIVGATGAGKSTLLKLLLRFYDVDEGTIRIDDHDIRDLTLESLREATGYVSQEPFLFDGTINENITYGVGDVEHERVVEAARLAGAHEFVSELSDGYETRVGERGTKLSGGQRQRIAIARAVIRNPRVLMLDEATSHVDNETEATIQRNLSGLVSERTTFAIAHRISTVRRADRILVIDDGRLVESGTHEELLESDGLYANLWRIQVGEIEELPDSFVERAARNEDNTQTG